MVVCFGAFDPLSLDHIRFLDELAGQCDAVTVALVTADEASGRKESLDIHAERVARLRAVDRVVVTDAIASDWMPTALRLFAGAPVKLAGVGLSAPDPAAATAELHRRGVSAAGRGEHREALELLTAVVRLTPGRVEALYDLARIAYDAKQTVLVGSATRLALAITPVNESLYHLLGLASTDEGLLETALTCFDRALRIKPDVGAFLTDRASALRHLGRPGEGAEDLRRAIGLDPTDRNAHRLLGLCLRDLGDQAAAAEQFSATVRLGADGEALHQFMEAEFLKATSQTEDEAPAGTSAWRHNDGPVVRRAVGGAFTICCFDLISHGGSGAERIDGTILSRNLRETAGALRQESSWHDAAWLLEGFSCALDGDEAGAAEKFAVWQRSEGRGHVRIIGPIPVGPEDEGTQRITHVEVSLGAEPFSRTQRKKVLRLLTKRFASTDAGTGGVGHCLCEAARMAGG